MEQAIKEFFGKVGMEKQPTNEELRKAVEGAIKDRAIIYYFAWKTIQELHPEIDADEIMREASIKFGEYKGEKWGKIEDAAQALQAQSSKTGILVFEQEYITMTPEYAEKNFHHCPHLAAFRELGCSDEEVNKLCQDMLAHGDYGIFSPHKAVRMEFKQQISKGDPVCAMCISKV